MEGTAAEQQIITTLNGKKCSSCCLAGWSVSAVQPSEERGKGWVEGRG